MQNQRKKRIFGVDDSIAYALEIAVQWCGQPPRPRFHTGLPSHAGRCSADEPACLSMLSLQTICKSWRPGRSVTSRKKVLVFATLPSQC